MRMVRMALGLWLVALSASAQTNVTIQKVTPVSSAQLLTASNAGTCTANSAGCAVIALGGFSSLAVQVSANASGNTLSFEVTNDPVLSSTSVWAAMAMTSVASLSTIATSTTSTGMWTAGIVGTYARVRLSTATAGTATVAMTLTAGSASSGGVGGAITVCGNNTEILYNSAGGCGASSSLAWDAALQRVNLTVGSGYGGMYMFGPADDHPVAVVAVDAMNLDGGYQSLTPPGWMGTSSGWIDRPGTVEFISYSTNPIEAVYGGNTGGVHFIAGGSGYSEEFLRILTTGVLAVGPFTAYTGSGDIGFARASAGVLEIDTGTAGTLAGLAVDTLRMGATPATAGSFRMSNNTVGMARNGAGSLDIALLGTDNSNNVLVGSTANDNSLRMRSGADLFLMPGNTLRWQLTGSEFLPYNDGIGTLGGASNKISAAYIKPVAVASLPTAASGAIAAVNDALAPVIGSTVVAGGAAYAMVNYNGANWTVIGK